MQAKAQKLLKCYSDLLVSDPYATKMVTSATLFGIGDMIAQKLDGTAKTKGYQFDRILRGAFWGGICFAPVAHNWYGRVLDPMFPGNSTQAVMSKMVLDQTIWAAAVNGIYLTYSSITSGDRLSVTKQKVADDWWPVMKANWYVWPAVQIVNFKFVPVPLQVPVISAVVLGWSAYLSLKASGSKAPPPAAGGAGGAGGKAIEAPKAEEKKVKVYKPQKFNSQSQSSSQSQSFAPFRGVVALMQTRAEQLHAQFAPEAVLASPAAKLFMQRVLHSQY